MNEWKITAKPDKFFFSFTQDDKIVIIGSRKVNRFDLSLDFDSFDVSTFGRPEALTYISEAPRYNYSGSVKGFFQVIGDTFEEALSRLLEAFEKEEQEEEAIRAAAEAARQEWTRSPSASGGWWNDDYGDDDYDYDDDYYDYEDYEVEEWENEGGH